VEPLLTKLLPRGAPLAPGLQRRKVDRGPSTAVWTLVAALAGGCAAADELPEGAVAKIGDVVIGPEDLAAELAHLGAYAQRRYRGPEGQVALLRGVIEAELMAAEARDAGYGDDPRVAWALTEAIADAELRAELQRRVPIEPIEQDEAALQRWYDAHPDAFVKPERRRYRAVLFTRWVEAEQALARLLAGEVALADLGQVYTTKMEPRDDREQPALHPMLFDPTQALDRPLPRPIPLDSRAMIAVLVGIEPAGRKPLTDDAVRRHVALAIQRERQAEQARALLAELSAYELGPAGGV
jgi:hypothetical protein